MYKQTIILLLLSGYVSSQTAVTVLPHATTEDGGSVLGGVTFPDAAAPSSPSGPVDIPISGDQYFQHSLSGPVITVIVFGVMAAIVGIILSIAYLIGFLVKKAKPRSSVDTDATLNSVLTAVSGK